MPVRSSPTVLALPPIRTGTWAVGGGSRSSTVPALLLMSTARSSRPRRSALHAAWALALPLFVGGLGIGLAAPPLVNVVLAGVPAKDAGAAAGVLTTVSQIGGAAGVALLGLLFFNALHGAPAAAATPLAAYSAAFAATLPWQIGGYVLAAALMLLLPPRALADEP